MKVIIMTYNIVPSFIKSKTTLLLLLVFSLCFSTVCFAQQNPKKAITLGGVQLTSGKSPATTTRQAILNDPVLKYGKQYCRILSYKVSVSVGYDKKTNKKDIYFGPFKNEGSKLSQQVLDLLNDYDGPGVQLFFDDIIVDCGDVKHSTSASIKYDN